MMRVKEEKTISNSVLLNFALEEKKFPNWNEIGHVGIYHYQVGSHYFLLIFRMNRDENKLYSSAS